MIGRLWHSWWRFVRSYIFIYGWNLDVLLWHGTQLTHMYSLFTTGRSSPDAVQQPPPHTGLVKIVSPSASFLVSGETQTWPTGCLVDRNNSFFLLYFLHSSVSCRLRWMTGCQTHRSTPPKRRFWRSVCVLWYFGAKWEIKSWDSEKIYFFNKFSLLPQNCYWRVKQSCVMQTRALARCQDNSLWVHENC